MNAAEGRLKAMNCEALGVRRNPDLVRTVGTVRLNVVEGHRYADHRTQVWVACALAG